MKLHSRAPVPLAAAGIIVLAAGLAFGLGAGVHAQTPATPTPAVNVGGPQAVPSARFYGSVTGPNGAVVPPGTTVTALVGGTVCGTGTVTAGQYIVDVQAITGCTTPGATVTFTVGGQPASQTGTLPAIEGSAVQLNLTVAAATPTPAPAVATPPPPPPPPAPASPTRTPTPAPTVAPTAIVPVSPPNTGLGGAAQQKPAAPVTQRPGTVPGAAAAAPAARPALPNTGTGSLAANHHDQPLSGWLIGAALVSLLGAGGLTLATRRR
ncbi:MAG TPA: hypothetical protein VFA70_09430 [Dehalococcoidia bacterium]|nr:hypothetical protein [Dehalococcoidia bacterium]